MIINVMHNTTDEIIPIDMKTLRVDIIPEFSLFVKNRLDNKLCYVRYNTGNHVIRQYHIDVLRNNKVDYLYILKNDQRKYFKYVEFVLQRVMKEDIAVKEKAYLVYNVAKNIMLDVLEDPYCNKNVKRSMNCVSGAVDFIMTSEEASVAMLNMVSYDYYTYSTHSTNVSVLGLLFAKYLGIGIDDMHSMGTGFLLHDIGKTQIDSSIVKKNGRLSNEEFEVMEKHVEKGVSVVEQIGGIADKSFYPIMQHHEREDGGGYPYGLGGDEIHQFGKIAKIVDTYDALTTTRPYYEARTPFSALTMMNSVMKGHFNLRYLKLFIQFLASRKS